MSNIIRVLLASALIAIASMHAVAEETGTQDEMRSLDGQVQEIKSDVLAIAKDLSLLEEKLLYPSNTQLAVFVSLAQGETFRLDAVQLEIDGELAAHYIYSFKELEALQNGGVQRVYTGNVPTGAHELTVSVDGKLDGGREISGSQSFSFRKDVDPKLLGLTLSAGAGGPTIELGDW
jgi:hypothetical protein